MEYLNKKMKKNHSQEEHGFESQRGRNLSLLVKHPDTYSQRKKENTSLSKDSLETQNNLDKNTNFREKVPKIVDNHADTQTPEDIKPMKSQTGLRPESKFNRKGDDGFIEDKTSGDFCLSDMNEEYIKGMEHMIEFMRKEGIICRRRDNCGECKKIYTFFNKRIKEINSI